MLKNTGMISDGQKIVCILTWTKVVFPMSSAPKIATNCSEDSLWNNLYVVTTICIRLSRLRTEDAFARAGNPDFQAATGCPALAEFSTCLKSSPSSGTAPTFPMCHHHKLRRALRCSQDLVHTPSSTKGIKSQPGPTLQAPHQATKAKRTAFSHTAKQTISVKSNRKTNKLTVLLFVAPYLYQRVLSNVEKLRGLLRQLTKLHELLLQSGNCVTI
jgi:hypothetical protein